MSRDLVSERSRAACGASPTSRSPTSPRRLGAGLGSFLGKNSGLILLDKTPGRQTSRWPLAVTTRTKVKPTGGEKTSLAPRGRTTSIRSLPRAHSPAPALIPFLRNKNATTAILAPKARKPASILAAPPHRHPPEAVEKNKSPRDPSHLSPIRSGPFHSKILIRAVPEIQPSIRREEIDPQENHPSSRIDPRPSPACRKIHSRL